MPSGGPSVIAGAMTEKLFDIPREPGWRVRFCQQAAAGQVVNELTN